MKEIDFKQDPVSYQSKPRYKDYYLFAYDIFEKQKIKSVLDLGTASADFLFFLPNHINGTGMDKSEQLIKLAKQTRQKPNLSFIIKDFVKDDIDLKINQNLNYDAITIFGTMVTINDYKKILTKVVNLKPKFIIINDFYNLSDVDTVIGYKKNGSDESVYNFAYNIKSKKTILSILESFKFKNFHFDNYHMKTKLPKSSDCIRNYHETLSDGETILTNGLGLILRGYNLVIEL